MFQGNLQQWERVVRFILGVLMLTWAIAGGATWGYLGVPLLATACWGFSPSYALFRKRHHAAREE